MAERSENVCCRQFFRAALGCGLVFLFVGITAFGASENSQSDSDRLPKYTEQERAHWSLQPIRRPRIPTGLEPEDRDWVANPIDAFILRKLQEKNLRPSGEAEKRTLVRRLYFDLLGLPPTPSQIDRFLEDHSAKAYERLIDRLLENPHYGERWGQHWLDVVRFAETEGFEYDRHHDEAWRFRDYVIDSFNDDKPYDQFIQEQLAGDELAAESKEQEQLIAAGFHRLGAVRRNAGNAEVAFSRNEVLTERTDVIGAAFLGLTVGCARCHDHMFDAIRQSDYYRLQGFLASTFEYDAPLADPQNHEARAAEAKKLEAEIEELRELLENANGAEEERLRAEIKAIEKTMPEPLPTIFTVRNDSEQQTVIHLLDRGDPSKRGVQLGMRTLGVLLPAGTPELASDAPYPKTMLAHWITDPQNPLTARVMVNRIWLYHFGRGLVDTPNDFGVNGTSPTHPELLDFLASKFIEGGWSIKAMHRLILTSRTYRQSSQTKDDALGWEQDPENRWLWRFSRRRLEAEEIRDSLLAVSGRLNPRAGGPSVMVPVDQELIDLLYKPEQWVVTEDRNQHDRRSIYLIAKRNLRLPFLEVFNQPDLQISCGRRDSSTHAPQALELLNGPFTNDLAKAFAGRIEREVGTSPKDQVRIAYSLTAGRAPTADEERLAIEFLKSQPLHEFALAMFNLNSFLYVD